MAVAQQHPSLDRFLRLPEQKPALEYLDGVITQKMSPKAAHSVIQAEFVVRFDAALRPGRLGHVLPELRTTYAEARASFVPDVVVYLAGRLPTKPGGEVADDVFDPPDIAAETLSPGQGMSQLVRRARWYTEHGVRAVVVANPRTRASRVLRPGRDSGRLQGDDVVDLGDVSPGFSFVVRDLFATLDVG